MDEHRQCLIDEGAWDVLDKEGLGPEDLAINANVVEEVLTKIDKHPLIMGLGTHEERMYARALVLAQVAL